MKTYLKYDGLAVLAHRGGAEESYENTLESFEYSQSLGCKFIETDVQVSSDGVPYIFHDDDLKRICDIPKKFASFKPVTNVIPSKVPKEAPAVKVPV